MNEQVVAEIVVCSPLDKDRLSMLQLQLLVISDFQTQLAVMIDEYDSFLVQNDQRLRQLEEQESIDRGET